MGGLHYGIVDWSTAISDLSIYLATLINSVTGKKLVCEHAQSHYHVLRYLFLHFQMGIDQMNQWMRQFGFGQVSTYQVKVKVYTQVLNGYTQNQMDERWNNFSQYWSFTATPLQLAMATAITANLTLLLMFYAHRMVQNRLQCTWWKN